MAIMASAATSLVIASRRLVRGTSSRICVATLRARPLYWRTTFAVQKSAIAVWLVVRVVLAAAPSDFTSLNAATHRGLDSDGGGAGWNWPARLSRKGRTFAIHGVCGTAYALGVKRQTPGPGGSVGNGDVEAIGVCRPSPARSRSTLLAESAPCTIPVRLARPAGIAASAASWSAVRSGSRAGK